MGNSRAKLFRALVTFLRPISRMLIRAGIGYHETVEAFKLALVSVAMKDHGNMGRPANSSRIAALTGLTRKEVTRVREALQSDSELVRDKMHSPTLLLQEWRINPDYREHDGTPLKLTVDGPTPSFTELVKLAGRGVSASILLKELLRVGCVKQLKDGTIEMCRSDFFDSDLRGRLAGGLTNQLRVHAETIYRNTGPEWQDSLFKEKIVYTSQLQPRDAEAFRRLMAHRIDYWVKEVDQSIDTYESLVHGRESLNTLTAGVGLYYFERET